VINAFLHILAFIGRELHKINFEVPSSVQAERPSGSRERGAVGTSEDDVHLKGSWRS
jgi:hypothetical protein